MCIPSVNGTTGIDTQYSLADHVYACRFSQTTVLLDLKRNRYFGVDTSALDAVQALTRRVSGRTQIAAWLASGLLQPHLHAQRPFAPQSIDLRAPLMSIEDFNGDSSGLRPRDVARFIGSCMSVRHALRSQTLYQIARGLQAERKRRAVTVRDTPMEQLSAAVHRFRQLRPFAFAAHDQCLFHALALTHLLTAQRLSATWVIGVRLHPWGAHSWVQQGSLLLDATPEAVREFTPIIAV